MASSTSFQALLAIARPVVRRRARPTASTTTIAGRPNFSAPLSNRHLSTTAPRPAPDGVIERDARPRWAQTPRAMQAPLRTRPVRDRRFEWSVNEDPALLDRMYVRLLGDGGDQMLSDEVKWLAVTHKSFDQGRRGYNDRLAFLGRRIVTLQASLALMESSARSGHPNQGSPDGPFAHPALSGLSGLTEDSLMGVSKSRLARLAARTGLPDVVRWLPRRPDNLGGSGEPTVLVEALFAIVGAVALQKGGPAAEKVARERILEPLGLGSGA